MAKPHRQTHRHVQGGGGDSGSDVIVGEGFKVPGANGLHLCGSRKERAARIGPPGEKGGRQGLKVLGHLLVV